MMTLNYEIENFHVFDFVFPSITQNSIELIRLIHCNLTTIKKISIFKLIIKLSNRTRGTILCINKFGHRMIICKVLSDKDNHPISPRIPQHLDRRFSAKFQDKRKSR